MEKDKQESTMVNVSRPQTLTDVDLDGTEFPQPAFVIPRLVPEGATILAGKPKVGKSFLAYNLGLSVAVGQRALGVIPVNQGEVLYLALEETPGRLKAKIAKMRGATAPTNHIYFAFRWPRVDEGGLERLEEWLEDHRGVKLVIIDTFARFRSWKASHAGYDRDYGAVSMIKKLADEKAIAIVLIHHLRKANAQDQMDLVMGSVGITGAADSVMILTRERLGSQSELFVSGRDIEEASLALRFSSDFLAWTIIGEAEENRMSEEIVMEDDGRKKGIKRTLYQDQLRNMEKKGLACPVCGNVDLRRLIIWFDDLGPGLKEMVWECKQCHAIIFLALRFTTCDEDAVGELVSFSYREDLQAKKQLSEAWNTICRIIKSKEARSKIFCE